MDTLVNAALIALLAACVVLAAWALDPAPADYQGLFPACVACALFVIALVTLIERRRVRVGSFEGTEP